MLKLIGIETFYGKIKALHGVSLEVLEGRLVCILGANGAGKTTILKTICGIANLKIATGIQTKLLTYMSYGIPSVCSQEVIKNFDAIKESKTSFYKNNEEMIKIILKYKRNKNFSLNASKRALKTIKKFKWEKVLPVLDKVLNKY